MIRYSGAKNSNVIVYCFRENVTVHHKLVHWQSSAWPVQEREGGGGTILGWDIKPMVGGLENTRPADSHIMLGPADSHIMLGPADSHSMLGPAVTHVTCSFL